MLAVPLVPLLVPGPMAGTAAGKPRMTSSTAAGWEELISSDAMLVTGLLEIAPTVLIRDPVISTRSAV